ncbi:MAG TPA: DMT family transporter, partial [Lacipirellulaceae bacterium]|nr:DMT family transporter [Lacipirellulaceae bacterium]
MSHLVFLFCCFVWGSSFILMDRAAQAFGPLAIGMGRMAGGAAVLALYCAIAGRWVRPSRTDLGRLVLVALLANVWPYVVQPYVMQRAGEHAFFGMLVAFVPLATMGVSAPMLGVWPTPRQLIGVLGGLACMALVVHDGTHRGMSPG